MLNKVISIPKTTHIGCLISLFLPGNHITVCVAPWNQELVHGDWYTLALVYGGIGGAAITHFIENKLG
jgi:hypothetical protein